MITLDTPLAQLKKIGPIYLKRLNKLGLNTVRDLFFHFPHRHDDFSQITPIAQLKEGQISTVTAEVTDIKNTRSWRRRLNITEALIKDKTSSLKAVWFNQPYLTETLKKGVVANFSGKVTFVKDTLCLSNPVYEIINRQDTTHTGRLVPVYHETHGLSSRYLRFILKPLLYLANNFIDYLPVNIKQEYGLIDLNKAVRNIHFPESKTALSTARFRLAFDELYLIQILTLQQRQKQMQKKAQPIPFDLKTTKIFVEKLPFKLTNDQRIAAWEIFQDLNKDCPMNRLLDGDVGSGKTVVAALAALAASLAKMQTAFMAPTEILARQHFATLNKYLKKFKIKIALLTSSEQKTNIVAELNAGQIKRKIKQGKIDVIIGTHALIQKDIEFHKLALAVVDEQHRFGVKQRAYLAKNAGMHFLSENITPHLLSMTATPIPRTLALTIYGDLDISLLKRMPKGRKPVKTKIVPPTERQKTYGFIANQIKQKKQVFVICPLIDQSEKLEVKSVTLEYEKLKKKIFPDFRILMLHGKLKSAEKEKIMSAFQNRQADILVSTSVVEVGVDIPNATVMMIEDADRFGLAQLHQFRGRVGRSADQAYCFLLAESASVKSNRRLKAVVSCTSGFDLAEKDLQLRGPGQLIGLRQSGLPDLTMSSLADIKLVRLARQAAQKTLQDNLMTLALEKKLANYQSIIHLE